MAKVGFGRVDITPRVGVELCGFGPFRQRYSTSIRDRLWARAMAVRHNSETVIIIACDLIGVPNELTAAVRKRVRAATGVVESGVMISCTHTHSGPAVRQGLTGWGQPDEPYLETLPARLSRAAIDAVNNLAEATIAHARVSCEGIALNRQYDRDAPPLEEVLRDNWRPAKPELTDTHCDIVTVHHGAKLAGFASSFGCHPVVCCAETRAIHGDFVGVATNWLEQEHPGATGLFLQGALGDVNSCVVHKTEHESMLALNVIAGRFARCIRAGVAAAEAIDFDRVDHAQESVRFSYRDFEPEKLGTMRAEQEAIFAAPDVDDSDRDVRMAMVYLAALRHIEAHLANGDTEFEPPAELQALKLGPITLLGAPLEIFQAIKNDVVRDAASEITLVLSVCNGMAGYAPDRTIAAAGGYAVNTVPMIFGHRPYARIHEELVEALLTLDRSIHQQKRIA